MQAQQTTNRMAAKPSDTEIRSAMADILQEGELSNLTSRIVRTKLEDKLGISLYERKKEIDKMLMEMIEDQEKAMEDEIKQENGTGEMNGTAVKEESGEEDEESSEDDEPSPKKVKKDNKKESHDVKCNDEELARKLHENERSMRARRSTAKRPVERKKSTKAKPKDTSGEKKGGYGKPMMLSPELAAVVGVEQMSRSNVVKRMWEVIRERNLADPKNKQFALLDEQLQGLFGKKRLKTFGMMKYLKKHIKDPSLIC